MLRLDENRVAFVFLALLMCDCCSEIADIFHSSCIGAGVAVGAGAGVGSGAVVGAGVAGGSGLYS